MSGDLLDSRLLDMDPRFPTRILWCLNNNDGCETLRDVVSRTEQQLMRIPNFGKKSLEELKIILRGYGLHLASGAAKNGTLPLQFPSIHERISRIEQRLDALERHPLLREVGVMSRMTPHDP